MSGDEALPSDVDADDEPRKSRAKKKKKEKQQYKSAQFIQDSDEEYPLGEDAAFWAREREIRKRMERVGAEAEAEAEVEAAEKKKRYWGRVNNEFPWVRRGGPMLISSALFYIRKKTYLVM